MSLLRRLSTLPVTASNVQRGTAFENWSMQVLQTSLSMSLSRVGGRADGGVDLQGWWWLPAKTDASDNSITRRRIRVIAQCKAEKKKIGPKYVRELEGVVHQFNAGTVPFMSSHDTLSTTTETIVPATVGLFISISPFGKLALARALSSSLPLALLYLPMPMNQLLGEDLHPDSEDTPPPGPDSIGSMVFNPALGGASGVLKGEFEPRWEYPSRPEGIGRPMLWWQGRRMPDYLPS
ncbi:hypothetical protein BC629DRAFT_258607 [Irpex lacteus]|nr:hypothetical protein BC629DRAFT_258607 [Irpex lacteus]